MYYNIHYFLCISIPYISSSVLFMTQGWKPKTFQSEHKDRITKQQQNIRITQHNQDTLNNVTVWSNISTTTIQIHIINIYFEMEIMHHGC